MLIDKEETYEIKANKSICAYIFWCKQGTLWHLSEALIVNL